MKPLLTIALIISWGVITFAQQAKEDDDTAGLDSASQEALTKTQKLLNDNAERNKTIEKSPDGKKADDFVRQLTGDQKLTDDIYALAAEVFANIVKEDHGNSLKMKEDLEKFQKNPEAFAKKWTPEQKQKLHDLSEKLDRPILKE